jgi:hypothetical protein
MLSLFDGWALLVRRADPEFHMRLMVQTIVPALIAAIKR